MDRKRRVQKEMLIVSLVLGALLSVSTIVMVGEERPARAAVMSAEQLPPVPNGNNALMFDGVDDYVEIPEIAAIRCRDSEPLTVEFWLFVPSRPDNWQKVLSKWGPRLGEDDEFVVCFRQNGTVGFADTGRTGLDSTTTLPTSVWCHFCCVWDSADGHYALYLDGQRIPQSLKGGAALRLTGEPVRIGTDGHHNQWFRGIIDEVRIWNMARTQGEIVRDMYRKLKGDEPGLKGYWDFDEGQGQVVHDLSERANRGKLGRLPFPDDSDPKWVTSGVELLNPPREGVR